MKISSLCAGFAACLLVGGLARADVYYTSASSWDAAVSGVSTVNFEGLVPASSFSNVTPSTVVGGDTFAIGPSAPSGAALFVIGDNFYGYGYATLSSQAASGTLDLKVTLPSAVTAIGFDYIVGTGTVTIQGSDGFSTTESASGSGNNFLFFGVTDPGGLTSIDITEPYSAAAQGINMKDFLTATSNTSTVPEPRSAILLAALVGVAGVPIERRRRRATAAN